MTRPLRVVLVSLHPDFGGSERHALLLARALQDRGHTVFLACHPDGRLAREAAAVGIATRLVPGTSQLDPQAGGALLGHLRALRPDVVHLHTSRDLVWGALVAWWISVPVLVITRHVSFPLRPAIRALFRRSTAIICLSETVRTLLEEQGIPSHKLVRIPGATDLTAFLAPAPEWREAVRAEWRLPEGTLAVGTVGRLAPGKGQDTLLRAIALLPSGLPVRYLLVGEGPLRPTLEAQTRALPLPDSVVFTGFRQDMPAVMTALDVLVLASDSEMLPLTIMEAQAAGCAVVASTVGGIPELIEDGVTGLLVPPGDPAALAAALQRLVENPTLRESLAAAGRRHAREHFSFSRLVGETEALYVRLLAERRPLPD